MDNIIVKFGEALGKTIGSWLEDKQDLVGSLKSELAAARSKIKIADSK
jgi:hypothetical protein